MHLRNKKPRCERGEEGAAAELQAGEGNSGRASLLCWLAEVKMGSPARELLQEEVCLVVASLLVFPEFPCAGRSQGVSAFPDLLPRSHCGTLALMWCTGFGFCLWFK